MLHNQVAPILPFITRGRLAGARLFRLIDQQPDLHDVEHSLAGSSSEEHGGAARAGSNAAAEEPGDSDSQVSVPMAAHQGTGELQEQELKGQLTFEHVCFAYPTLPDLPVLRCALGRHAPVKTACMPPACFVHVGCLPASMLELQSRCCNATAAAGTTLLTPPHPMCTPHAQGPVPEHLSGAHHRHCGPQRGWQVHHSAAHPAAVW